MTADELLKKYPNKSDCDKVIASMTRAEMKEVIDSMGTAQGKSAAKKDWERLTGNKY